MTRVRKSILFAAISFFLLIVTEYSRGTELTGSIAMEGRFFAHSPAYPNQKHQNGSLALNAEFYKEYPKGSSITIAPFVRLDSADSERTHYDLREFNFLYLMDNWELKAGVSRVFWGVTEFVHLVDIINQTDLVEGLNGEDKLGQPMLHLTVIKDWGVIDGFILPYFRQRSFPGEKGRLRTKSVIDTSKTRYESGAKQYHTDLAVRFSQSYGAIDTSISQFIGTSREPTLTTEASRSNNTILAPYYPQISQTGFDIQLIEGEWLWKCEAFFRAGQGRNFAATSFGFEYTIYGLLESSMDLGVVGEYVFDDRDNSSPTPYENDIMLGLRWKLNDADDSQLLAGMTKDLIYSSIILTLEGSRRIGESAKIQITGGFFAKIDDSDPIVSLKDDDFIKVEAVFFF